MFEPKTEMKLSMYLMLVCLLQLIDTDGALAQRGIGVWNKLAIKCTSDEDCHPGTHCVEIHRGESSASSQTDFRCLPIHLPCKRDEDCNAVVCPNPDDASLCLQSTSFPMGGECHCPPPVEECDSVICEEQCPLGFFCECIENVCLEG
ncbi:uncharacterized protein LOC127862190 [Dreissena polymorpha]|nr:uncharacterized protein LOC127862190 [Dreissena polymorpha]